MLFSFHHPSTMSNIEGCNVVVSHLVPMLRYVIWDSQGNYLKHNSSFYHCQDLLTCQFCQMYSLGIMFFEMCYPPMLGMQRAQVLEDLRRPHPVLPSDFDPGAAQAEIIMSLLTHNPKERPSSTELLKSNKLPDEMESDTIRRAM